MSSSTCTKTSKIPSESDNESKCAKISSNLLVGVTLEQM